MQITYEVDNGDSMAIVEIGHHIIVGPVDLTYRGYVFRNTGELLEDFEALGANVEVIIPLHKNRFSRGNRHER